MKMMIRVFQKREEKKKEDDVGQEGNEEVKKDVEEDEKEDSDNEIIIQNSFLFFQDSRLVANTASNMNRFSIFWDT